LPANFFGKLTTVLFYLALFMLMLDYTQAHVFLWSVIILSYITSLIYLFQLRVVPRE
jgi:cardiolipin synthase (CMP-forming)